MDKFILTIKDASKKELLLRFLNEINFIHIEVETKKISAKPNTKFKELFGIWKNRALTLEQIRDKAWKRN
ncbi:MAG: hypothetical protein Q8N03_00775 [Ignavibacteria bacterium]|jgi:hypothetical protein|nr:hypothetical protein [Ignavibacteria bacterium]